MLNKSNYVAVIKWKRGERGALEDLDSKTLSNIIPLIEIQPITYDHDKKMFKKTIDQHLEKLGENLSKFWTNSRQIFIDGFTLYDDPRMNKNTILSNGLSPMEFIIEDIENQGIPTIPVTTLNRSSDYNLSLYNCLSKFKNDLAIRIYLEDLNDVATLQKELDHLLSYFNIPKNKVHLFFDLKEINYSVNNSGILIEGETIQKYIENISKNINKIPYSTEWKSFTLLCTSVIDNFSAVSVSTNTELPRLEWLIYKGLLACHLVRIPNYGDYTVNSSTWFDFNPKTMTVAVCVKYTVENNYLIFKGVSANSKGNAQIYNLCQDLIKHPEYCGRSYSAGDEFIYQCGIGIRQKPGNPETRIRYWVNHHLTLVSNCLTNLPVNVTS